MAKLLDKPITQEDLAAYLDESSDFAFELKVLKLLTHLGFECSHGGPYSDPVTGKTRQFDIRATRTFVGNDQEGYTLAMAVECKNLRPSCPLMVLTVPRTADESYHQVYWYNGSNANCVFMRGADGAYPKNASCGKSLAQVGRTLSGDLVGPDSEVYDKWVQALASGAGMVVIPQGKPLRKREWRSLLPVVVVPDGTLWMADYDTVGGMKEPPKMVNSVEYYVGHEYALTLGSRSIRYFASHVEFVTFGGLEALAASIAACQGHAWRIFGGASDAAK